MEALHGQNAAANTWNFGLRFNGYIESFTYDPNGNIKTLARNSNVEQIDDLTYNYLAGTNKLTSVADPIPSGLVNYDIDGQGANNYSYDRIGNMTADNAEGITNISWTVYGKIKSITKSTGTIDYRYDASGNRIYKKTVISGTTIETYYTRDAQGNVMAVYEKQAANPLKWMEQHLYGSSRLGMWNLADVVPGTTIPAIGGTVEDGYLYGSKFFELSNHLGNVLVTVSDKKIGIDEGGNGTTDYFQPEVLTAQDYYSFGMAMPGRKYTKPSSGYRYGFNGKENDNEVKGEGNQQDYGMRIYDPRLGKFLSVDPIAKDYPELTPFQFASNKPINSIDLDGLESKEVYQIFDPGGNEIYRREYKVDNPYKLGKGTLYNIYTQHDVNIRQVNPSTVEFQRVTIQSTAYVPKEKTWGEKLDGILSSVSEFFSPGSGSYQEFGFVLTGNGITSNSQMFDLVSSSKYKEHLDMKLFIGVMSNLREFSGKEELMDLSEALVGTTKFNEYLKAADNIADAAGATKDGIEELIKKKADEKSMKTIHCLKCAGNFYLGNFGVLSNDTSKEKPIDTVKDHGQIIEQKPPIK